MQEDRSLSDYARIWSYFRTVDSARISVLSNLAFQPFREGPRYFKNNNNNRSRAGKVYNERLFYSIYSRLLYTLFYFYVVLSRSSIVRCLNAYYRSFYFYHGYLFSDLSHPFALSITYYFISAKSVPFFPIRSSSIIYFRFISIVIFHSGDLF